jgi:L-iditol 2-dehydrogenase
VLRGQNKVDVHPGDSVFVVGAGPIGLLHIALAKARGAALVLSSARTPARRQAAQRAGSDVIVDPNQTSLTDAVAEATGGKGVDVVITAAPVHAVQAAALHMAAPGGRVLLFAGLPKSRPTVELDTNIIHYKELLVTGTTASTLEDCKGAAELVVPTALDVGWMVSDLLPLHEFAAGIDKVEQATALKVVLKP